MKKIGVLISVFLFVLLLATLISAAENTTEEKAISCLENKVKDKCSSLNLEQQAFTLLAISKCKDELKKQSNNNECYPSSGCKIKDTSLAILALKHAGTDTKKAEDWLLSKKKIPSDLEWYLEIDSSQATTCKISDGATKTISIDENKKISGDTGTCFSLANNNYWLKIKSSCFNKNITVSCDKGFISTLLYKKTASNIWHVSSDVKSDSSGGKTEHQVESYCFSVSGECNYEDNLWASLALTKTNHKIKTFLPYLIIFSEDNENLFPSSFLYLVTSYDEYLNQILSLQKDGYWKLNQEYYDTALALLALSESDAESQAKDWLSQVQGTDGCWNSGNIRDTAFLLWAGWPKAPSPPPPDTTNCEPTYYCMSTGECDEVEGNVLRNYYCSGLKVCCDKPKKQETCKDKGGLVCETGKTCSEATISTSDEEECCLADCEAETTKCEEAGYNCRTSCLDTEESVSYDCESGKTCCKVKVPVGKSYWWVWLLAILIVLVILGIIFRNRLRVLIFKLRGGFKSGEVTKTRPYFPPGSAPVGLRRMIPPAISRPLIKTATKTDKELEETLKKLREMSK